MTRTATRSGSGSASGTCRLFDEAPRGHAARREHALLPLQPRRAPSDRRGQPGRQADRGAARPRRPCLLQLDAPVDGRARAARPTSSRRPAGSSSGSTRAGRRSGTTGASACTAVRSTTCSTTSRASRCSCCATATLVDQPDRHPRPGQRLPGRRVGARVASVPADNSRPFVQDGPPGADASAPVIRAGAAVGQFFPPRGVAPGQPAADRAAPQGRQTRTGRR